MKLETTGWYAMGIPLVAAIFAAEILLARRSQRKIFGFAETISNLSAGLGTLVIGLFTGPLVLASWEFAQTRFGLIDWHGSPWRWPFALLLSDLCYYAHHRAGHRFAILWAIHGVHHQHEHLNTTVGLRLEWLADVSTFFFFAAMPLLGIDSFCGFITVTLLSLYALTTHSPPLERPSYWLFITPGSHGAHHSRDSRFDGKNFASMFTLWDRALGTWAPPVPLESLRRDLPTVARMHDGISSQFVLLAELLRDARARGVSILFRRPVLTPPPRAPRDDSSIPRDTRLAITAAFVLTGAFAMWLLWLRDEHSFASRLGGAGVVLVSLRAIGGLLDGRWLAARATAP